VSLWTRSQAAAAGVTAGESAGAAGAADPLAALMADPGVDEVLINGPGQIWVERAGRLAPAGVAFPDHETLRDACVRLVARAGRRLDESEPMVDARLADGSRINVVLPPIALDGPLVSVRRFAPRPFSLDDLLDRGTVDRPGADLLARAVAERRNLIICGATSSGKTATLGALAGLIDARERIVTVEDAAELRIDRPHVVRLEGRLPNLEGRGAVPIRALVRNALRMRPDRLVVGEVRGAEALDMLQAMATGHDGSLSTVHATGPADALRRLETLALMSEVELPHSVVREQVAATIDLVVHQRREADGRRRVVETAAVLATPDGWRLAPADAAFT
jgi:pilus assembly protein CpaF